VQFEVGGDEGSGEFCVCSCTGAGAPDGGGNVVEFFTVLGGLVAVVVVVVVVRVCEGGIAYLVCYYGA